MLTTIKLNKQTGERNTLRVETSKNQYTGKLETTATIVKGDPMFFEFQLFHDFLKTVIATEGRATKKRVADQHQKALNLLGAIMVEAIAHYQKKGTNLAIDSDVFSNVNQYQG